LVGSDCIQPLCDLLTVPDSKLIMVVMEALDNILAVGENFVKNHQENMNPYTTMIEEAEGKKIMRIS
jgi:importin subunit alpha-1